MKRTVMFLVIRIVILWATTEISSAVVTWDGGGSDSNWHTPANWSSNIVPTSSDTVIFNNTSIKYCILNGNVIVKSIRFYPTYIGSFDFVGYQMKIEEDADFSTGGNFYKTNSELEFFGSFNRYLIPPQGKILPIILHTNTGTTTIMTNNLWCDSLVISNGVFEMNSQDLIVNTDLIVTNSGIFNGSSGTIRVYKNIDISSSSSVFNGTSDTLFVGGSWYNNMTGSFNSTNTGTVLFNSTQSGNSLFPGSDSFNNLVFKSSVGSWTLQNNTVAMNVELSAGYLNFGAGLTHNFKFFTTTANMGTLTWNTATVHIDTLADFQNLLSLNSPEGQLIFSDNGTGNQTLIPKYSIILPAISHTGTATLNIINYDLTCRSFSQTAGNLNLNALDITTVSGGNFTCTNGTATTLENLGGSILTIAGNANFAGQSGTLLLMDPGTLWYLRVSGSCTADYATIGNCNAVGFTPGIPTTNCIDNGNNTNWLFNTPPNNLSLSNEYVNENEPIGTTIGNLTASDPNGTDTHIYTLVSGTGDANNASFTIVGTALKTAAIFDYELKNSYSIRIRATDNGVGSLSFEKQFTITIHDLTDGAKPLVTTLFPANNATSITSFNNLVLTFNETVFIGTGMIKIKNSNDVSVVETIDVASTLVTGNGTMTITINPTTTFLTGGGYYIIIDSTCFRDSENNYFSGIYDEIVWNFTIGDIATLPPMLVKPPSNSTLYSTIPIEFSLPEAAFSGSVIMTFSQTGGVADTHSPHRVMFHTGFEISQNHSTVLVGSRLSNNANVISVNTDPNDVLVAGAVYTVSIEYQDSYENSIALDSHSDITYHSGNTPVYPVTNITVEKVNTTTITISWINSSSPDIVEQKLCLSAISPPITPLSGEMGYSLNGTATSHTISGLSPNGVRLYWSVFVRNQANVWSDFSDSTSGSILLQDEVPPTNAISGQIINVGDSAISVSLNMDDSIEHSEAGIYFTLFTLKGTEPDTQVNLSLSHHDTTFTVKNTIVPGHWYGTWAPFDSAQNVGIIKKDSCTIFNTNPHISIPFTTDTLIEDSLWMLNNYAYDINNDPLSLTFITAPSGMLVSQKDLTLTWSPQNKDVGSHDLIFSLSDNKGQSETVTLTLIVVNTNDPPVIQSISFPDTVDEDKQIECTVLAYDPDNHDSLTITLSAQVSWLQPIPNKEPKTDSLWKFNFIGTPHDTNSGYHQFKITVLDKENMRDEKIRRVTVLNANDAPKTHLHKKLKMFGAAQYQITGYDDIDTMFTFHAQLYNATSPNYPIRSDTVKNSNFGIFNFYPLIDGQYIFSCFCLDRDGLSDRTPYRDTFSVLGASTHSFKASNIWDMVSIPSSTFTPNRFKSMGPILHWDESQTDKGVFKYYARSKNIEELEAGKSYWVKLDSGSIDISIHQQVIPKDSFVINLTKAEYGWNQIASPFPYPVRWNSDLTLWEWDDKLRDFVEYEGILYPWEGYWVHTEKPQSITLSAQPYLVTKARSKRLKTYFVNHSEWTFGIELTSNINRDVDNLFGISRHARNTFDPLDRPEPPRMGQEPYLFFAHPEWKRSVKEYASDIRQTWIDSVTIFQIGISPCENDITALTLTCKGKTDNIPVFLWIHSNEGIIPFSTGKSVSINPKGTRQYHTIFATRSKDFLNNFPFALTLKPPFPNPIRGKTVLQYTLPYRWKKNGWLNTDPYEVSLILYDARGRITQELIQKKQNPGHYQAIWRGRTGTGRRAASGTYFCRLLAGNRSTVQKLIMIR